MITEAEAREALEAVRGWILSNDPEGHESAAAGMQAALQFVLNDERFPEGERVPRFLADQDLVPDDGEG